MAVAQQKWSLPAQDAPVGFDFDQVWGVVSLGPQFSLVPAAPVVAEPEVCPLLLMGEREPAIETQRPSFTPSHPPLSPTPS